MGRPLLHSRRVPAGITPPPGALGRLTVWWGRTDWLEVEVRGALREHRGLCREHHVDPDTVYAVARAMAGYADARTGRDCRPTNERMVAAARCSLSTVQRARRVLLALGLVVKVTEGRSVLTLSERLKAWQRGSAHRAIAAEFALCSRGRHRPRLVDNRPAGRPAVDRDTPPVGQVVRTQATEIRGSLRSTDATRRAAPRPAHTGKSRAKPVRLADLRARRLAQAVKRRLAPFSDVPAARMTPALHKLAVAGWTDDDVELGIRNVLAARGHRLLTELSHPAAYLASLVRDLDPEDRPTVAEAAMEEMERRERHYEHLRVYGPPCPHGMPAGHVVSPRAGVVACPFCRGVPEELEGLQGRQVGRGGSE